MSRYHRLFIPGGVYFFTVVTYQRRPLLTSRKAIALLREAFRKIKASQAFEMEAVVILPDHLHCIWRLPPNDADFSGRWREIKKYVSKRLCDNGNHRNEYPIWQRRFWEHALRNENDWQRHMDYIHYNPVKHGLALSPAHWPYSSFAAAVRKGWYPGDWGQSSVPESIQDMELE